MLRENVVRTIDGSRTGHPRDTICVHGDTPDAVAFARELRAHLASAGITVAAPLPNECPRLTEKLVRGLGAARRHHDRDRFDDWLGYLHHIG